MKSISCSAVLACGLLALMLCARASSAAPAGRAMGSKRRLLQWSYRNADFPPQSDDALSEGPTRDFIVTNMEAQFQRGTDAAPGPKCYKLARNSYCEADEDPKCCTTSTPSQNGRTFSGCDDSDNDTNCPGTKPISICCY